jgi:hypothetical protein
MSSASVVFLCLFIMINGFNALCGAFIPHLLRKARGCCMHMYFLVVQWFKVVLHFVYVMNDGFRPYAHA